MLQRMPPEQCQYTSIACLGSVSEVVPRGYTLSAKVFHLKWLDSYFGGSTSRIDVVLFYGVSSLEDGFVKRPRFLLFHPVKRSAPAGFVEEMDDLAKREAGLL
jgi:hypothetical protein